MKGRKRKVWEEKESEESDKGNWKYESAKYIKEKIEEKKRERRLRKRDKKAYRKRRM